MTPFDSILAVRESRSWSPRSGAPAILCKINESNCPNHYRHSNLQAKHPALLMPSTHSFSSSEDLDSRRAHVFSSDFSVCNCIHTALGSLVSGASSPAGSDTQTIRGEDVHPTRKTKPMYTAKKDFFIESSVTEAQLCHQKIGPLTRLITTRSLC